MKHILVFGTFDGVHKGHEYLFEQAKKLGDKLSVVVARDKTVLKIKKNTPKYLEGQRLDLVKNNIFVDQVYLGSLDDKYKIIIDLNPDIIALGYDQKGFADNLEKEMKDRNQDIKIVRLNSFEPDKYKSSIINKS